MKSNFKRSKPDSCGLEQALSEMLSKRNSFVSLFHSYHRVQDQIERLSANRLDDAGLERCRTIQTLLLEMAACLPADSQEELKYKLALYRLAEQREETCKDANAWAQRSDAQRRPQYH